jgi:hypothetical protein
VALLAPASASARLTEEHGYDYDQVWRAAVRLVAVDLRFPITDRDAEIGYVLFEYVDQGRSYQGSIELVRAAGESGERIRVVVQVPGMPSYVERMILDRFARKLVDEYGPPRVRRPAPRPTPPPAADDEEEEGERDEDATPPSGRRS